ncbi:H-type small acid-soluble spore protein [Bacillus sp. HMF5848]|uniref:H-type small acid-soluble spore protein n=1 Tax=Bacillus sp. HMF5848 TaxID=2495421 RepID=UPI000F79F702|nr:H-type small acid-soluble spore protein [Bacillus sp. HMF5848]RSK28242.1 H-type small acid-soluble spore protein [Bacillus sp. HMF5848]
MEMQRAKQIVEAGEMANVYYNDEEVYIQHIDEQNEMARIFPLQNKDNEQDVPVRNLTEK